MHTKRKTNNFLHERITLRESLLVAFAVSSLAVLGFSSDTSATVYTASITASPTVTVDLGTNKTADVKSDNVVVNSTCPLGYTLTIMGPSDSNLYKGGDSTASSITATTGTSANPKAITGEGNLDTWGYSLDSNTTISSSSFIGLTNTTNTLVDKNSASATSGDTTTIYYGASTSTNKEPGTYTMPSSGAITYALTADPKCSSFEIVYDGNDDDGNTTMSVEHSNVQEGDDITLYASNYIKAGYGFAGWSTVELDPDSTNFQTDLTAAVAAHKVYGPNETITTDSTFLNQAENINGTNTITLYAVWVAPTGTIQNWTGCGRMSIGDITALTDQRDNNVYTVARLADGNCWMAENLRLDNTNSDNATGAMAQGYGGTQMWGRWQPNFIGLASPETVSDFYISSDTDPVTPNSLYYSGTQSGTATMDIGTANNPIYRMPRYSNLNTASTVSDMTDAEQNVYSYGNYYNWPATVANTANYDTENFSLTTTSICPTGWRIPRGGNKDNEANNDFWDLIVNGLNNGVKPANYNSSDSPSYEASDNSLINNIIRSYPNNYVFAGMISQNSAESPSNTPLYRGGGGYLWASTVYNFRIAYRTTVDTQKTVSATQRDRKAKALSVRCVAQASYTVHFDANGGTGTMADQEIYRDTATGLTSNSFTAPSGYYFAGWNTKANGTGTSYNNSQSVTNLINQYQTITLYAQWSDCPPNNICYSGNDASSTPNMSNQTIGASDTSATLRASNFKRSSYGFAGWNTKADGTGTNYGPNEVITFTAGKYNTVGLKLYARWIASAGNIQSWSGCSSLSSGSVTALTDLRDSNTYAVAKLADGKCWMIENLRLDDGNSTGSTNISRTQGYASNFTGLAAAESSNFTNSTVANSLYSTSNITGSNQGYRFPRYNNKNTSSPVSSSTGLDVNTYSYGNHYTWAAAIASTTHYNTNNTSVSGTSICPKGWHLPTAGDDTKASTSEFRQLSVAIIGQNPNTTFDTNRSSYEGTTVGVNASKAMRKYPNNFVFAGSYDGSASNNRGASGYYWSTTANDDENTYNLAFDDVSVYPGTALSGKYNARSIRCVAGN